MLDVTQQEALAMMRRLAREEDLLRGQLGGAVAGALRVAAEIKQGVVVAIICDRGSLPLHRGVQRRAGVRALRQ